MAEKSPSDRDAGKALQLLLVEDSRADVLLIRESLLLCAVPVHVTVAYDGAKALSFLKGGYRPDLVILDLNIPKISGLELLAQYESRDLVNALGVDACAQLPLHNPRLPMGAARLNLRPRLMERRQSVLGAQRLVEPRPMTVRVAVVVIVAVDLIVVGSGRPMNTSSLSKDPDQAPPRVVQALVNLTGKRRLGKSAAEGER